MDGISTQATATRGRGNDQDAAFRAYLRDGEERAMALGNRGPIRFDDDGRLAKDILDAYWRCGFYIFEGVLKEDELADIEADVQEIRDRLPVGRDAKLDAKGRPLYMLPPEFVVE